MNINQLDKAMNPLYDKRSKEGLTLEEDLQLHFFWCEWNYLWYTSNWKMYGYKSKADAISKQIKQ